MACGLQAGGAPTGPGYPAPGGTAFATNGVNAAKTGGRTGYYIGLKPYAYEQLYFTQSFSNPYHSTQGSGTGEMQFTSYDSATGIATWTSTVNAVWASASGTRNRQTRARVQFQPNTGTATGPLGSGWLVPTTAGEAGITSLPANYPVLDVAALADPDSFQVWVIIEDVLTGQAILDYYDTSNSTAGGQMRTGVSGGFYAVLDATEPVISGSVSPTSLLVGAELPDYRGQLEVTDNDPSPVIAQSPAPGTIPAQGTVAVTITATDLVGNEGTYTFDVNVAPPEPVHSAVQVKGAAVAAAGIDPRVATGALWKGFSVPSVTDSNRIAYLGKWSAVKTPTAPAQSGVGVFLDGTLIVKAGDPVNGIPGAVWKSFSAPVAASANNSAAAVIAFSGKIAGDSVTRSNDSVIATTAVDPASLTLTIVAREGDAAPQSGGALYKAFNSVALSPGAAPSVVWAATLLKESGVPAVASTNDRGVWTRFANEATPRLVVREGLSASGSTISGDTLKYFSLLRSVSGISGASIGVSRENTIYYRAVTTGGIIGVGVWSGEDVLVEGASMLHRTGDVADSEGSLWKDAGTPVTEPNSLDFATVGRVVTITNEKPSGVSGLIATFENGTDPVIVARVGDSLPGGNSDHQFKKLGQPVLGSKPDLDSDHNGVAFTATIGGPDVTTANDSVLVWRKKDASEGIVVAREGDQVADAPVGAQWKAFKSLVLPARGGPLFTATLVRGAVVTAADDFGCWAVDSSGELRGLFREGDEIDGKTLKSFNVLKTVSGSPGVSRAAAAGKVVWLATFTDRSTAVMQTEIP